MKKTMELMMAAWLCITLAACGQEPQEEEIPPVVETVSQGEVLEKAEIRLPYNKNASYDPITTTDLYNYQLSALVFDSLFTVDETMNFKPALIDTYTFDGINLNFSIKGNVFFHDGTALTSADVVYTLQEAKSNPGSNFTKRLENMLSITAVDVSRVEIILASENALFPALLDIPIEKAMVKNDIFSFVGTGKYAFDEEFGKLIPNEFWYGEVKGGKEIPLVNVPDEQAASFAYNTGEITLFTTPKIKSGINIQSYVTNNLVYIGVNTSKPTLSDKNIRLALSSSISRTKIVDDNMQEGGFIALSPIHSKWFLYDLSKTVHGFNSEKAAELFMEAGFTEKNENGILVKKEAVKKTTVGKPLQLRLLVSKGNYDKKNLAETIAYVLKEHGVEIALEEESYVKYKQRLEQGDFDLYLGEIKMMADMDFSAIVGSGGSVNYGKFSSAAVDACILAVKKQHSKEAVGDLIVAMDEEMPIIPLFYKIGSVATPGGKEKIVNPTAFNPLNGI